MKRYLGVTLLVGIVLSGQDITGTQVGTISTAETAKFSVADAEFLLVTNKTRKCYECPIRTLMACIDTETGLHDDDCNVPDIEEPYYRPMKTVADAVKLLNAGLPKKEAFVGVFKIQRVAVEVIITKKEKVVTEEHTEYREPQMGKRRAN